MCKERDVTVDIVDEKCPVRRGKSGEGVFGKGAEMKRIRAGVSAED